MRTNFNGGAFSGTNGTFSGNVTVTGNVSANNGAFGGNVNVTGNLTVGGTIQGQLANALTNGDGYNRCFSLFNNTANATVAVNQAANFNWTGNHFVCTTSDLQWRRYC